jgi:flagellar assembly protein FliH
MAFESVIRANQATGAYPKLDFASFDAPAALAVEQPVEAAAPAFEIPPEPAPAVAAEDALVPVEQEGDVEPMIKLPTAEDIEQIHQQAFKDGYDAGYEEGSARGRLEAAELHQLVGSFDEALTALDKTIGEEVLSLALEIARLVVRDTISTKPEIVATVIREALLQSPHPNAQIRVHPADAELARRYLAEQLTSSGHRLVEDPSIERGGCKIEAGGTHVDATIATRWRRVTESLSQQHPWQEDEAE